jgi:hypothetical protein
MLARNITKVITLNTENRNKLNFKGYSQYVWIWDILD